MITSSGLSCSRNQECFIVCTQKDCHMYAPMCSQRGCECTASRKHHFNMLLDGLLDRVQQPPDLPEQWIQQERFVMKSLEALEGQLKRLRQNHRAHLDRMIESHYKFRYVGQALQHPSVFSQDQITGANISRMLQELDEPAIPDSPYGCSQTELKKIVGSAVKIVSTSICELEKLWNSQITKPKAKLVNEFNEKTFQSTLQNSDNYKVTPFDCLTIKLNDGTNFDIRYPVSQTVHNLLLMIARRTGRDRQKSDRLVFKGNVLRDQKTLSYYNIRADSVLELITN